MRFNPLLFVLLIGTLISLSSCDNFYEKRKKPEPEGNLAWVDSTRHEFGVNHYYSDSNWLRKNSYGLWEMYLEGKPFDRGVQYGILSNDLMANQEKVFFNQIKTIVPDSAKLNRLRKFVAVFNRNLPYYFIPEYQQELLGTSYFISDRFDWVGPKYFRALNLHGAHDIGHALQDLMLVGCTSFAAWGPNTEDGGLLLGRNFDFYAGEGFSEEKMVVFMKPDQGIPFMMISWPGFLGVVSGMNTQGLTVTINAGKSGIPTKPGTPISILTREILQYASTIEEAIEIAESRQVFVSESILVGSQKDGKAVIIEKSPKNQGVYVVEEPQLVCSNHFQSEAFSKDKKNLEHIEKWHSQYRMDRMNQLLAAEDKLNYTDVAEILRETDGLAGKKIGYGNEKAINQLMAHHGIIFQPGKLRVWVSANPYQLGAFVCYDLNRVFELAPGFRSEEPIHEQGLTVPESDFLQTDDYKNYLTFRRIEKELDLWLEDPKGVIPEKKLHEMVESNPDFWLGYYKVGKYFEETGNYERAKDFYEQAMLRELTTEYDRENLEERIKKCKKKIK
ncbi:acyl-CoA--6-aminopenicillanic acid acyl-transferase [bacterium SCSIO 12741]|nr:acyl-CoA--6-aminopenicillanic acid acyl-transferase [bacterium SCSIO 12741]